MSKFKKLIASILILANVITSVPITSFAGGFNNNAAGDGHSTASGNGLGGDGTKTLYTETSGYRITLVDPITGHTMSKSIDILFSNPPANSDRYTASRVEDASGQSKDNHGWLLYSDIVTLLSPNYPQIKDDPMPYWFIRNGGSYDGNGAAFKDWFCPETAIDALSGLKAAIQDYNNAIDKILNDDSASLQEQRANTSAALASLDDMAEEAKKAINSTDEFQVAYDAAVDVQIAVRNQKVGVGSPGQVAGLISELQAIMTKKFSEEMKSKGGVNVFKDNSTDSNTGGNSSGPIASNIINKLDGLFSIKSYAGPDDGTFNGDSSSEKAESNIEANGLVDLWVDEAKTKYNVDKYGWALAILSLENGGVGIFAKNGENKTGFDMAKLFQTGQAYACVEPILFFNPQTGKGNMATAFYGTPWNYTSSGYLAKLNGFDPVALSGGNIFRGTNKVFFTGVKLASDEESLASEKQRVPFLQSKPFQSAEKVPPSNYGGRYGEPRYRNDTYGDISTHAMLDTYGLGMQLYCISNNGSSSINTYNVVDTPTWDDNSEPAPKKPDESKTYIEKNKNKTFQIVKFYRIKFGENNYFEWSYYSQGNTPHTVQITDEKDIGWKLMDWFTSPSKWMPENGGNPRKYPWESYVKTKNPQGTYSGTEEELLTVLPDDPDNTLYLLYEAQEPEEDGKVTVIRVYDDEDGNTDRVEREEISENPYPVPTDDEYEYIETKVTPNEPKDTKTWGDSEGDPKGTPPSITYPDDTKTIYIHYKKKPKDPETQKIVLWEDELSYNYDLRDLLKNRRLIEIYDDVPAAPFEYAECSGHTWYCGDDDCDGHVTYCHSKRKKVTDTSWTVAVQDNFNQNTLPFIKDWVYTSPLSATGRTYNGGAGGDGFKAKVKPQATYLLIRDKESDIATLYPKKNQSLLSELSQLNLKESYTSSDTRYNHDKETDNMKRFYRHLYTQLAYSGARDTELAWWTKISCSRGSHTKTGNYNTSTANGHGPEDANSAYSKNDNVEIRYFLGKAGSGTDTPNFALSDWQKKYKTYNYRESYTESTLSLYPYLEYTYYYKDNKSGQPVMVTSSNLSTMKVFNAVQIGVYKKDKINAYLTSTQWSTHARSLSYLKNHSISDKKSILPGGAIQDIDMGNKGDTQIGLTLWQTCLKDDLVETVQQSGFKVSESEARSGANALQEEIKKTITGYGLVQWGAEGTHTEMEEVLSGEELHEKTNVSFVKGNGGVTSADEKYYLRHDGDGSNRANFDCLDSRIENQYLYTIKSDTKGNVIIDRDGTELGRISKTENLAKLLSVPEIKLLDDNTKLVSNYVKSIDRNLGESRKGNKWYNEAHDGVSVLRTEMSFDVGFNSDNAHRTNVLDPLLTAKAESKSDLYNFDESLVRSSVYATRKTSTSAIETASEGYMGTLKGVSGIQDLKISLKDIQKFVYTKNFYIPNANVTDLN